MKITNLQTNHLTCPVGYRMEGLRFSWQAEGTEAKRVRYTRVSVSCPDRDDTDTVIYDSGEMEDYPHNYVQASFPLAPCTRYRWRVLVTADNGESAEGESYFETAKMGGNWDAEFIGAAEESGAAPCLYRKFLIDKPVKKARAYVCGLGLYECGLNGEKLGDEYLLPGYHSYDRLLQYDTFVLDKNLRQGENCFFILLGNGWYKDRFVFEGGYENLYGTQNKAIAELRVWYEDGTVQVIGSGEGFRAVQSPILDNNIYDGETVDMLRERRELPLEIHTGDADKEKLRERVNPPVRIVERRAPAGVIRTPKGETVLDFGEMLTGWVEFFCREETGAKVVLSYGEILQDGSFYRDNLRTAKAEFCYRSGGGRRRVRPHFTYYGFRYVLVEGVLDLRAEDFTGCRLMSDIRRTGMVKTSDDKVNRLFENTLRSQKCNFLDIPTDCPQRDERMGWTGDTAVFAKTACLHMDCAAFFCIICIIWNWNSSFWTVPCRFSFQGPSRNHTRE